MSLWRKRNVQHNGQNQPKWFNMTALANNDLSIKSDNLSIKSEEAMREVQRLGQEIEQEPVAWYRDEDGIRIYYETKVWDDCTPLYTHPQQRTWVGLTDEEIADCAEKMEASDPTDSFWREFFRGIEAKLKEKNT
jgi:hypothetical protein